MDLNTVLHFLVTISCCSIGLRTLISRNNWGWLLVALGILIIMGTSHYFIPQQSGLIGGIFWLIFILIPIIGLGQVNRLVYQEHFGKARGIAIILSWLHPGDGWQKQPQFLKVLALIQKGEIETANTILNRDLNHPNYGFHHTAKALQFRIEANWNDCLSWLQKEIPDSVLWRSPTLATLYLRSLGEVGDLNGLVGIFQARQNQIKNLGSSIPINLARLYVFAFLGEVREVKKLLGSTLKVYPQNLQMFWLATAQMALGNRQEGENLLLKIREKDIALENAIVHRLSNRLAKVNQTLNPEYLPLINVIKTDLNQEINYGSAVSITPSKANLTYSLMLINVLVFILEITQGGSQNLETLARLGAAIPKEIVSGEPWRVFTANFLHFGYIHLISNMLGLWILSPYVEFYLGWFRYLIVYFFSGIGAISLFAALAIFTGREDDLLVGASAAIMGLMGATFMILWRGWRQEKSKLAQEKLQLVTIIILLQVGFDFSVANVSFLGHFFGLILGIISTFMILLIGQKNN